MQTSFGPPPPYLMHTSFDPPPPYSASCRIDSRQSPEAVENFFAPRGPLEAMFVENVVTVISTAQKLQPLKRARAARPSEDKALQAQSLKMALDRQFVNLFGASLREAARNSESFRDSLNRDEMKVPSAPMKEYLVYKDLLGDLIEPGTCKLSIVKFQKWRNPDKTEQAQFSMPVSHQETEL
ncbi:hypothetical protein FHW67_001584 [Herbaspirillum sp. Sphag1AN]|uniref:hypothetical protein n=1 Tax=unclassified Herbaspirillum TaxID=2624150 RepID=UPI00161DD04D|nr:MULTISPECIES: hypothetical protein [unclassified Herbaspirillum]MBB3212304.1 hypothetical protein [Herbaspirillum sp. Sphag1AN]MBB3245598.1 hypothetical protein [Herbaspirillum sp. Sphag64]